MCHQVPAHKARCRLLAPSANACQKQRQLQRILHLDLHANRQAITVRHQLSLTILGREIEEFAPIGIAVGIDRDRVAQPAQRLHQILDSNEPRPLSDLHAGHPTIGFLNRFRLAIQRHDIVRDRVVRIIHLLRQLDVTDKLQPRAILRLCNERHDREIGRDSLLIETDPQRDRIKRDRPVSLIAVAPALIRRTLGQRDFVERHLGDRPHKIEPSELR